MELDVRPSGAAPVTCALCHDALGEPTARCSGCGVRVHAPCSLELGRCPTLGCPGRWGETGGATKPATGPRPARRRAGRAVAVLLGAVSLAAWASTFRAPDGAERVLGGWFTGHGSLPAAVVATFGVDAPPALGGAPIEAIAFTADSRRLISAGGGELIAWDVTTGVEVARASLGASGVTPWLSIAPSGRLLVPVGLEAELWDLGRMERIARIARPAAVVQPEADEPWRAARLLAGVCTDEGGLLAYATPGLVTVTDVMGAVRARLATRGERSSRAAFSSDGRRVAVSSSGRTWEGEGVEVWQLGVDGPPQHVSAGEALPPLAFSPRGRLLVWHCVSGTRVWDVVKQLLVAEVPQTGIGYGASAPLALSPDLRFAAVASFHGLEVHHLRLQRRVARHAGHGGRRVDVRAVAWSPDGRRIATGGDDQRVIVWRAP